MVSVTPLRLALKSFIFELNDSALALVFLLVTLKGVLSKDYARPALDKQRLGELIDFIGLIILSRGKEAKRKDVLGLVFEYFLGQFADAEGKRGG